MSINNSCQRCGLCQDPPNITEIVRAEIEVRGWFRTYWLCENCATSFINRTVQYLSGECDKMGNAKPTD